MEKRDTTNNELDPRDTDTINNDQQDRVLDPREHDPDDSSNTESQIKKEILFYTDSTMTGEDNTSDNTSKDMKIIHGTRRNFIEEPLKANNAQKEKRSNSTSQASTHISQYNSSTTPVLIYTSTTHPVFQPENKKEKPENIPFLHSDRGA